MRYAIIYNPQTGELKIKQLQFLSIEEAMNVVTSCYYWKDAKRLLKGVKKSYDRLEKGT